MAGKKLMKFVDLGEPTSFLVHVYLGCIQRGCKPIETIIDEFRECSNHEFLLEQLKNYQGGKRPHAKTVAWSYDTKGHAPKFVERCCELANKKQSNYTKSQVLAWMIFKEEELESVGELSKSMLANCPEMLVSGTNWLT